MLATQVGSSIEASAAAAYEAACGGNPVLLNGLIEDLKRMGRVSPSPDVEIAAGEAFEQAVFACLYREEPVVLDVAQALAVLGNSASLDTLSRVSGIDIGPIANAMDLLTVSGLLESGWFRHPAVRTCVLKTIATEKRVELYQRAAELLYHSGAPASKIAVHLVAAGQLHDQWSVSVMREAAEEFLGDDQIEMATACVRLALRGNCDGPEAAALNAVLARIEWRTNPASAIRYFELLRDAFRNGHLNSRDAGMLVRCLLWHGRLEEAADVLNTMGSPPGPPDATRAHETRTVRHWLRCTHPQMIARLPEGAVVPQGNDLALVNVLRLQAASTLAAVLQRGASSETVESAEHVLRSCRFGDFTVEPLVAALYALIFADRASRAQPWCDALLEEAGERNAVTWQAVLSDIRADIALRQGDMPLAESYARTALKLMPARSWGVAIGAPLATHALAMIAMGRNGEAEEILRRPVPEATFQSWYGLSYMHARGCFNLATNRPSTALDDFKRCGELMTDWKVDLPAFIPWRTSAARAQLLLGCRGEARNLVEQQLNLPGAAEPRTRGASLRLLAALSEVDERPGLLLKAADLLEASHDRFELACSLAELSKTFHLLGEFKRARGALHRSMHMAKTSRTWEYCQRLLDVPDWNSVGAGTEVYGPSTLSEAERRVAVQAAFGHSNREIGHNLHITVSTVEQHLTRVYRKLGINRRTELVARMRPSTAKSS